METQIDWKEQKFQEKLAQIFEIAGTDFYYILSKVSDKSTLPSLDKEKDEKIVRVNQEYPTLTGDQGSRPDIYVETNKGNVIIFELKPADDYDEQQLDNHDSNMKKWIEEEDNKGKTYLGTVLILNRDSERDNLNFGSSAIYWIGWDNIYKALSELKINILDSKLRNDIDKILSVTPINKVNETLKNQLLRETEKSTLFNTIRTTVLVVELMDQLKSQMNLEEMLKKYEPIEGNEAHNELTEKVNVLFNSIWKAISKEFQTRDYCAKIERSDYNELVTLRLKDWRGWIEINFKPHINQAHDYLIVRLYMQSGKKYSMLTPLIALYRDNLQKFEEIEKSFEDNKVSWYCKYGNSPPINVEKKNISEIEQREYLPIYCDKKIKIYGRETDEIYTDIAETIPILVDVYLLLLDYGQASID